MVESLDIYHLWNSLILLIYKCIHIQEGKLKDIVTLYGNQAVTVIFFNVWKQNECPLIWVYCWNGQQLVLPYPKFLTKENGGLLREQLALTYELGSDYELKHLIDPYFIFQK